MKVNISALSARDVPRHRLCALILTLWIGSLWTVCGIVAPGLFAFLPERAHAGAMAGLFFQIVTWLGLISAVAIYLLSRRLGLLVRVSMPALLFASVPPLLSALTLGPLMRVARAAGNATAFGLIHAGASLMFLVACVAGAVLVWKFNRPAE